MTAYHPVILRAVAALETNTFEARRAIYNYARAAQSEQLHNRPFNKRDFDHERLMLEDAIARVEIEVTHRRIATGPSPRTPVGPSHIAPIPITPLSPVDEDDTRKATAVIAHVATKVLKHIEKMFARDSYILNRTFQFVRPMSALPPKADIDRGAIHLQ